MSLLTFYLLQARPLAARTYASAKAAPTEVSSILESKIRGVSEEANLDETGRVLAVGYVLFISLQGLVSYI